ncbi:MAG: class I SAM-dependent methyltransferase family protein [Phycisphaerae bacterium]
MESWVCDIEFERHGTAMRLLKAIVVNPLANYLPAAWLKGALRFGKSQMAAANWEDPGGWRSMVLSYDPHPRQVADKILVATGTMAMALRNRKRLAARVIARLIDDSLDDPVHVLCLGAGPGHVITDAMVQARKRAVATLVDLNSDAFEHGRQLAQRKGVADRVRFVEGDVREVRRMLAHPPDMVKMLGICEYLSDEQIADIARAVAEVMPPGAPLVLNSLSKAHRTDRFFRRVFGLHMNHRSPEHLQRLIAGAGFGDFISIPEPLGVYHVVVGRRMQGK